MNRIAKYLIAVLVLLIANLWLFFSNGNTHNPKTENYFDGFDLAAVDTYTFLIAGDTTTLRKVDEGWNVNDKYPADPGFVNSLKSVLQRINVNRTLQREGWKGDTLGIVEIKAGSNSKRLIIATNPTKTKTFFVENGNIKKVSVPGYRDNVADVFTLHPDQWRDRTIFDGNWRTIQRLTVENKKGENFEIKFDDTFFLLDGAAPQDSSSVVRYLNLYENFQANEMISQGRFPDFDSLAATAPDATISIEDIKRKTPFRMSIYPSLKGQAYHLVVDSEGRRMVLDVRRVRQLLTSPN